MYIQVLIIITGECLHVNGGCKDVNKLVTINIQVLVVLQVCSGSVQVLTVVSGE